ncbi:MAG: hypothetical protein WC881_04560 [Elusimicrobiota bacterium]|jgi:hypothetical protein
MNVLHLSVLALAATAVLSGCVAETVRKNTPRKGPVAAVGYVEAGGGEIRYSTEGWSWFVAGRRRDALRRMRRICRPLKSMIVDEAIRQDADVSYSQEDIYVTMDRGSEHFTVAPYVHYLFECVSPSSGPVRAIPLAPPVPLPAHPLIEAFAPTAAAAVADLSTAAAAAVAVSTPALSSEPLKEKLP